MHSNSAGPLLKSVLEKRRLACANATYLFLLLCAGIASTPIELTFVCSVNGRFQSGKASTVGYARLFLRLESAPCCSSIQSMGNFRARFVANVLLRRMALRGDAIMMQFLTLCRYRSVPGKCVTPRRLLDATVGIIGIYLCLPYHQVKCKML